MENGRCRSRLATRITLGIGEVAALDQPERFKGKRQDEKKKKKKQIGMEWARCREERDGVGGRDNLAISYKRPA